MRTKTQIVIMLFSCIMLWKSAMGHEPIYGLGPETLSMHLSGIEFGSHFFQSETEYYLAYSYGINQNWTIGAKFPFISSGSQFGFGNMLIKIKYALWRKTQPGAIKRLTAIAAVKLPTSDRSQNLSTNITAATLGLANGYESRRWYYFSSVTYTFISTGNNLQQGNILNYNLAGGIRPIKTPYTKPDLVFLIELNGRYSGKSKLNNETVTQSGGNTLAIAPGFLFSYRNLMLKGGIQFGITNTKYISKKQTNGLISLEYHF